MKRIYNLFLLLLALCLSTQFATAQCTSFAQGFGPWGDIGNAPCVDQCGSLINLGFEAYGNEAYLIGSCQPGAEYVFAFCENYDANTWAAMLTVADQNDNVIAFAEGCELTFTIPTTYSDPIDVIMYVSVVDNCGGAGIQVDNGIVTFGCGANGGQQACLNIPCSDGNSGTLSVVSDQICAGEAVEITVNDITQPTSGNTSGFIMVVTTEDISGSTSPNTEDILLNSNIIAIDQINQAVNFNPITNDGSVFPNSSTTVYYLTPVVFSNAIGTDFATLQLDPNCTFTGTSVPITIFAEGDPICGPVCPDITVEPTECDSNGQFNITVTVTNMGGATSIEANIGDASETITTTGVTTFGPYDEFSEISVNITTGLADCNLQGALSGICEAECNIAVDGGFENGPNTDWAEGEVPDQSSYTVITGDLPYEGSFGAWLGGYGGPNQLSFFEQELSFPDSGLAELSFFFLPGICGAIDDYFRIIIDGDNTVYEFLGDNPDCGSQQWFFITVDISEFADGNSHTLRFEALETVDGTNSNFFVDNVAVSACSCGAAAGNLNDPVINNSQLTISASNTQTNTEYNYLYLLTDGAPNYNIIATSTTGTFDLSALSSGTYMVHGLSIQGSVDQLTGIATASEILQLIEGGIICGDLILNGVAVNWSVATQEAETGFGLISLSPIPAKDLLQLSYINTSGTPAVATIFDISGKKLSTQPLNTANQTTINISHLPEGLYILSLSNGISSIQRKFVKE